MITRLFAVAVNLIHDMRTNNISLINVLDQVNLMKLPAQFPVSVLLALKRELSEPAKGVLYFKIMNNSNEVIKLPTEFDFGDKLRTRVIIEMNVVEVKEAGELTFMILKDEDKIADYSIEIVKLN